MDKDVKEVVKAVIIIAAETAVMVAVIRYLSKPDNMTMLRMRVFRGAESVCQSNAEFWANTADVSRRMYDSSRSITF